MGDLRERIMERLDGLPEQWVVMVESMKDNTATTQEAVRIMEEQGPVIIVTATRPAKSLLESFDDDIDRSHLTIIDCVSRGQQRDLKDTETITYVSGADALTDISIELTNKIKALNEDGKTPYIYLDSINSFLMHNDSRTVARFVHGVLTRIRLSDASGMVLNVSDDIDEKVRSEIAQLCDRVISI